MRDILACGMDVARRGGAGFFALVASFGAVSLALELVKLRVNANDHILLSVPLFVASFVLTYYLRYSGLRVLLQRNDFRCKDGRFTAYLGMSIVVMIALLAAVTLGMLLVTGIAIVLQIPRVVVEYMMMLVLPLMAFFSARWSLAGPAVLVGGRGPVEATGASWEATSGHSLTILIAILIPTVLSSAWIFTIDSLSSFSPGPVEYGGTSRAAANSLLAAVAFALQVVIGVALAKLIGGDAVAPKAASRESPA